MALPEHLQPKTYWEERTGIAEEAVQQLAQILAPHLPQHANDALRLWMNDWNRILIGLKDRHPPLPAPPGEKL